MRGGDAVLVKRSRDWRLDVEVGGSIKRALRENWEAFVPAKCSGVARLYGVFSARLSAQVMIPVKAHLWESSVEILRQAVQLFLAWPSPSIFLGQ